MAKIELRWMEGGKPYSYKTRLFRGWDMQARFDWTPFAATTMKCKFGDFGSRIHNMAGITLGKVIMEHGRRVGLMRDIEELIRAGATVKVGDEQDAN